MPASFPKHNSPELLSQAIREVLSGKAWFEQSQLQKIVGKRNFAKEDEPARSGKLTERERQVLSFVFDGLANKEIADQLQVSESSVKGTCSSYFRRQAPARAASLSESHSNNSKINSELARSAACHIIEDLSCRGWVCFLSLLVRLHTHSRLALKLSHLSRFRYFHAATLLARHTCRSTYVSLDSWIYPAFDRLHALGYADTAFLGLRPWTRLACLHMLQETSEKLSGAPRDAEARRLFNALAKEFKHEINIHENGKSAAHAEVDSVYGRAMGIAGPPINDSYHFGQTIINDYGRPYQEGFNAISGFSARAEDFRFTLDVRGEYQHAPGRAAYPDSVRSVIAQMDENPELPATPVSPRNAFALLDANASMHLLNHEISVGKSEDWWGPGQSGSMAWSNNAEPIYALRINRVEPLRIPLLSKLIGPVRYEGLFGSLKGHAYPNAPWVHAEKFSFKPTPNLEFGFSRVVVFAGEGHVPLTFGSFWNSFTSFNDVIPTQKFSRNDPGARHSQFDFSYRLPGLRKWVTLYTDSVIHDDVSPIDNPHGAAINPGIYLSHFPKLPRLDLRVEAVSTDAPTVRACCGDSIYWETVYHDAYTNQGNLLGSWIGRDAKGGQAWLTYWLSPKESIQLGYRNVKASQQFVPGGTTQNDFSVRAVVRVKRDIELNILEQLGFWKAPVLATGLQKDFTSALQITYFPKLAWHASQ